MTSPLPLRFKTVFRGKLSPPWERLSLVLCLALSLPVHGAPETTPSQPGTIQADKISAKTDDATGKTTVTFTGKVKINSAELYGDCDSVVAITRKASKPGQKATLEILKAKGKVALWQNGRRLFADEMDIVPGDSEGDNRVKVTLRGAAIIQQEQQTLGPSPEISFWLRGDQVPKLLGDPLVSPAVPVQVTPALPVPATP